MPQNLAKNANVNAPGQKGNNMGIEMVLSTAFLKGAIGCMFGGVGGLIVLLLRHSTQLSTVTTKAEGLDKRFEQLEADIKRMTSIY